MTRWVLRRTRASDECPYPLDFTLVDRGALVASSDSPAALVHMVAGTIATNGGEAEDAPYN